MAKTKKDCMPADERKWRAEDAHRDIMRAETHKRDRDLMKDVANLHAQKLSEMKQVKIVSKENKK